MTIETKCPHCGHRVDAATCTHTDAAPKEGDVALCVNCGGWTIYGDGMQSRLPTDAEAFEIARDVNCQRAQAAYRSMKLGKSGD